MKTDPVAVSIEHRDEISVKEPPTSVPLQGKEAKKTTSGTQTESHMHPEEELDWKSGVSKHTKNTCNQLINTIIEQAPGGVYNPERDLLESKITSNGIIITSDLNPSSHLTSNSNWL